MNVVPLYLRYNRRQPLPISVYSGILLLKIFLLVSREFLLNAQSESGSYDYIPSL